VQLIAETQQFIRKTSTAAGVAALRKVGPVINLGGIPRLSGAGTSPDVRVWLLGAELAQGPPKGFAHRARPSGPAHRAHPPGSPRARPMAPSAGSGTTPENMQLDWSARDPRRGGACDRRYRGYCPRRETEARVGRPRHPSAFYNPLLSSVGGELGGDEVTPPGRVADRHSRDELALALG